MESKITKGEFKAKLDGNASKVVRKDGLNVALMISGEKYYCDERLKDESWMSMFKRTEPEREREAKEVEENAKLIETAFNIAQKHDYTQWQSRLEENERMREALEQIMYSKHLSGQSLRKIASNALNQ